MNLEEAKANIGAEVELNESTKPYTFMYIDGNDYKRISDTDDSKTYEIIDFDDLGNAILEINGHQISPRHLKLKPQNYKIHVPTDEDSREAQELFFALGYEWMNSEKYIQHTDIPYLYSYSDEMKIAMGWSEELFESHKNKQITLQDLRDMVAKKKGIKSIGVDLASGDDKKVQVTGTIHNFEPRKEMTWQDAFQALIDGKEVEMLDIHNQWENIKEFYLYEIMEKGNKFRLAPQRITLNGEYTKEELLQKIGEMA